MEMTREQVCRELQTLRAYFADECGAVPVCINEAIRYLTPDSAPLEEAVAFYVVKDRATGEPVSPYFEELKTARLAMDKLEHRDIMNGCFEPDTYMIEKSEKDLDEFEEA